jgi:predicted HTH domain antitoxin
MTTTTDFIVPKEILQSVKMSPQEMAVEIAVYLYEKERLTLGQAKRLAGLDQISFQKELAERNVYLRIREKDVLQDVENLGIKK